MITIHNASTYRGPGEYVGRIFGNCWTAIDHVEQLPRRLPELFLSLTR